MNRYIAGKVILPLHERLMRRPTFAFFRQLDNQQWWRGQEIRRLQLAKLRALVAMAMNSTESYSRLAGLDRSWRPESLEDLRHLPLLDKATISAHREQLVNAVVAGGPIRYNTGGSSGQPLIFYIDRRRQAADKAARMLTHQWWGAFPGAREAYLWGSPVELSKQDRLKNFRDRLTNEMLLGAFDLSPRTVGAFAGLLRDFRPDCLFGYPSSIAMFCQLARRQNLDLRDLPLRAVFSTAEVLYEHQKELISESFGGVPVVNGYGSREGGFIAHECPHGRMHVISPHMIVEFIRNGRPAPEGQDGEIVVTHLDNHACPFIRYRTGDVGQADPKACPCGRGLEVMRALKGRTTDFIITADGRWVHGLALIYTVCDMQGVSQYQIVQNDVDRIAIRLVCDASYPAEGDAKVSAAVKRRLGQAVRVDIQHVSRITQDASGKYRYVISHPAKAMMAQAGML